MQVVSSNLFLPCRKFSDFVPRASSALRNFKTFLSVDSAHLLDALGKRLKFHINIQTGLKNSSMGC